jgi:hypothetical protein
MEAAMRQLAAAPVEETQQLGLDLQSTAIRLPTASWFYGSAGSPQFWSGAESDELAVQLASLLRTCLKIESSNPQRDSAAAQRSLVRTGKLLGLLHVYAFMAWATEHNSTMSSISNAAGETSSSSNSRRVDEAGSSSSLSSWTVQLSNLKEPCPQPLLQLASLLIMRFAIALAVVLQVTPRGSDDDQSVQCNDLAGFLFDCLGHVHWLRLQLQQQLLPGDLRKAAAALQGLQEQQQQLQQALEAAVWRLNKFALVADSGDGQAAQVLLSPQELVTSGSNISSTDREGALIPAVDIDALASSRPEGSISLADLSPDATPDGLTMAAATAAALVGAELPQQLQQFGSALWSALPQPRCCNSAACANLGSISEAKLVAGRASRCSKCKVAK